MSFVLILLNIGCNFRDSEIPIIKIRVFETVQRAASPRLRDLADVFRDASFSIDHSILLAVHDAICSLTKVVVQI